MVQTSKCVWKTSSLYNNVSKKEKNPKLQTQQFIKIENFHDSYWANTFNFPHKREALWLETHWEFRQLRRYSSSSTITGGMLHVPWGCPNVFPPTYMCPKWNILLRMIIQIRMHVITFSRAEDSWGSKAFSNDSYFATASAICFAW